MAAAVAQWYEPLIDLLIAHPSIDTALHVGGHLLEWLEASDRALADRLASLVSAGEAEIIGGGFYSPILALLLWRDAVGQLEMTAGYLERRTGVRPTGAWLIEQVWMPRMAEILSDAGVRWTLIDERALRSAGVNGEISGWYVTEHAARPVAVFPVDHDLKTRMASDGPDEVVDYLRARLEAEQADLTLTWAGDIVSLLDHPSRGLPWLQRLFERATEESSWLTVVPPSRSLETTPSRGRVYLPDSLHPDLVELTLPPAEVATWRARKAGQWLLGSIWQAFLARYGEADRLHKRMIEAARRFAAVERVMRNGGFRAMNQLQRPRRMLYRGQTGAAYGHGHRAGIHDADLRAGVYRNLIRAEVACDELVDEAADDGLEVSLRDLFADMTTSVLVRSRQMRVVLAPSRGGAVVGLEHIPTAAALHDVLTRRAESYHPHGAQPTDGHERALFHDRFVLPNAPVSDWMTDAAERSDLMAQAYRLLSVDDEGFGADGYVTVHLSADGTIETAAQTVGVALLKSVTMVAGKARIDVKWSVELSAPLAQALDFGVECNLSGLGADPSAMVVTAERRAAPTSQEAPSEPLLATDTDPQRSSVAAVHVTYPELNVTLRPSIELGRLSHAPIVTCCQPVGRPIAQAFQGVALLFRQHLAAGSQQFSCGLTVEMTQRDAAPLREEGGSE